MKSKSIIPYFLFFSFNIFSQSPVNKFEYGASCRLTLDLLYSNNKPQNKLWFNWKFAISQGFIYNINCNSGNYYRPALHIDYTILQGGCGSNDIAEYRDKAWNSILKRKANGFFAVTLTPIQYANNFSDDVHIKSYLTKPLYYFDDVTYPVLTNPYEFSISIGTTFLYNFNANGWQRIGNGFLSYKNFQILYSNDGPPFAFNGAFGDRRDRWFTGQGLINFHHSKLGSDIDNFELSYHRFTGWSDNSYEISRDLALTEVSYKTEEENKYNRGKYELKGMSSTKHYGVGIIWHDNYYFDMQHLIHYRRYYAHHISPYPTQFGISVFGQTNYNTILK